MSEKAVFSWDGKKFYKQDIINSISQIGIKEGDVVYVHSDLTKFGKLSEIKDRLEYDTVFLDACKEAVGKKGTIVIPTFTYSFGDSFVTEKGQMHNPNHIFDIKKSPSILNYFTEVARLSDGFFRSEDPMLSVVSYGLKADQIINNISNFSLGKGSVWENLHKQNAHNLMLGFKFDTTFIHYIEEKCNVPYRHNMTFSGKIVKEDLEYEKSVIYFANNRKISTKRNRMRLYEKVIEEGILKKTRLGGAHIMTITSNELFESTENLILDNPHALVDFND